MTAQGQWVKMAGAFRLVISAETGKELVRFVRSRLRRAHEMLRAPVRELGVVFVGDRRMIALHGQFMDLRTTTDVLTFPMQEDGRGRMVSGEVYVCIAEARRQAKLRGIPVEHEVLLYALHGLLHLCGFDDRTEREHRKMHHKEDEILTGLGIGRVYARQIEEQPPHRRRRRPAVAGYNSGRRSNRSPTKQRAGRRLLGGGGEHSA
jgi:probable rRNA maturation factor